MYLKKYNSISDNSILKGMQNAEKWGTTTVGLVYDRGVVFSTDTRVIAGSTFVAHKKGKKVLQISDHSAITIAGSVAFAQNLVDILRIEAKTFQLERGYEITIKALANVASIALWRSPPAIQAIIGGYDMFGPSLFQIDPFGGITQENFVSTGSGSPVALGVLESNLKKEKVEEKEAVEVAVEAVLTAMSRDTATGNDFDVAIIDEKGYRELKENEKNEILKAVKRVS
ncbi:MAG: proteasome subunit beta [Thermoproteota archaeon]|nr:proteasome subunit beta [Candidatus Brockarchaeota archaeon]MBO3801359.1 proteasome subunit beta [Candidatus Brockarchaeota archaeon]